jgi:hypothetical protein
VTICFFDRFIPVTCGARSPGEFSIAEAIMRPEKVVLLTCTVELVGIRTASPHSFLLICWLLIHTYRRTTRSFIKYSIIYRVQINTILV